ncbi:hypothetical protein [Mycobacterium sp.]|nr:hypothetical protein [Mycobacterium sp.]
MELAKSSSWLTYLVAPSESFVPVAVIRVAIAADTDLTPAFTACTAVTVA